MSPPPTTLCRVRFGPFQVDPQSRELFKEGIRVKLQGQPCQVLSILLEHPGELVTREELQRTIWPDDTFVDFEQGLNKAINKIREALRDSADHPRFVETLPRKGYRFIGPVEPGPAKSSSRLPPAAGMATKDRRYSARWVVLIVAAVIVVLLGTPAGLYITKLHDRLFSAAGVRPAIHPKIESIAVLPLESLSGDPEQAYFADGMTEALITNLSKATAMRVISRTSVMRYKGTKKPLPQIARELKVDAVVEGSVQRSGSRVSISANLLHAPTDRHLWAETYERDLSDVLALQSEVAHAIAREVQTKVSPQVRLRGASSRPASPAGYEAYLRGRFALNKRAEASLREALAYFGESIQTDPGYAPAYAGLAATYVALGDHGFLASKEAFPKARDAANNALKLDDGLSDAHVSVGSVKFYYEWDWLGAERELKRAIELNTDNSAAHQLYSLVLMVTGRPKEGLAEAEISHRLDPVSPSVGVGLGWRFYLQREYDSAIKECEETLRLDPDYAPAHNRLGLAYEQRGMLERAISEHMRATALSKGSVYASADLARSYAIAGNRKAAMRILSDLSERAKGACVLPFDLALIYEGLGDRSRAFEALESALQERNPGLVFVNLDPRFDPLRSDRHFQDFLRRMNFPS